MDYTKIPRELIYRDKTRFEDFHVNDSKTSNAKLYTLLKHHIKTDANNITSDDVLLQIFNDVYYICTMALSDDSPADRVEEYRRLTREHDFYSSKKDTYSSIALTIVDIYLMAIPVGTSRLLLLHYKLKDYYWTEMPLEEELKGLQFPKKKYFSIEKPRSFILLKTDWSKLTNNFQQDLVFQIVGAIGRNKIKKRIVLKAIYDSLILSGEIKDLPLSTVEYFFQLFIDWGGTKEELTSPSPLKRKNKKQEHADDGKKNIKPALRQENLQGHPDNKAIDKCFKFNNSFVTQNVSSIVTSFYQGNNANLALIEITLFHHQQLKKRNSHKAFIMSLAAWGIITIADDKELKSIAGCISDKYKRLPKEGYKEWGDTYKEDRLACERIGEKLDPSMAYQL